MIYNLFYGDFSRIPCPQCTVPHSGVFRVCDGCITAAQIQIEGALGGRIGPVRIAQIFDMGGAGIAPRSCRTGKPAIEIRWGEL